MLNKAQKSEIVQDLVERFKRQKVAIFSDFRGISVVKSQALRRLLRKENAEYKVAKKTLLDRALAEAGVDITTKDMKGEIGVAFGYGDEAAPAKALAKFSRENETFKVIGGLLDMKFLTDRQILALARLPSREILLAQVAYIFSAPIRGLSTVLMGNIRNLSVVLQKIKEQKQTG